MTHNKCHKYSLYWAATEEPPESTCDLEGIITQVSTENVEEPGSETDCINYGYLYNAYSLIEESELSSSDDWYVPSYAQATALNTHLGGLSTAGIHLKKDDSDMWLPGYNSVDNSSGFSATGTGNRNSSGTYAGIKQVHNFWLSDTLSGTRRVARLSYNSDLGWTNTLESSLVFGNSVRFVKDATGIADGVTTVYEGNDGKLYPAIVIDELYWITVNLAETKYRDGSWIPGYDGGSYTIISGATWGSLTTGAMCAYEDDESNALCESVEEGCYGFLYNWFATQGTGDSSIISDDDWFIPTRTHAQSLADYLGAAGNYTTNTVGLKLKVSGTDYWDTDNGTNDVGFDAIGAGQRRTDTGTFVNFHTRSYFWTPDSFDTTTAQHFWIEDGGIFYCSTAINKDKRDGLCIRLVKDATGLADGVTTTYTGNDNKTYNAIVINELYWLTENLEETQYRDNSNIVGYNFGTYTPISTVGWEALGIGALCLYDDILTYECLEVVEVCDKPEVVKASVAYAWKTWNILNNHKDLDVSSETSVYDVHIAILNYCSNSPYTLHQQSFSLPVWLEKGKVPEVGDPVYKYSLEGNCELYPDTLIGVLGHSFEDDYLGFAEYPPCFINNATIIKIESGYITQLFENVDLDI